MLVVLVAACSDSGSGDSGAGGQSGPTTTGGGAGTGGGGNTSGGVDLYAPPELTRALEQLTTTYEEQFPGTSFAFTFAASEELQNRVEGDEEPDIYVNTANLIGPVAGSDQAEGEVVEVGSDVMQLIVARGNPKGVDGLTVFGPDSPIVAGLCEQNAPCGYAAAGLLASAGVTPSPDVLSPSGPELLETILGGRADAGLMFRTDARSRLRRISTVSTPPESAVEISYQMLLMKDNEPARAFVEWVRTSESARQVLRARGLLGFY
ncbi:MAG: molybdate ABC transporter substrate-binding protein [Acidimicrobiia bacterium]